MRALNGQTTRFPTATGTAFITVNSDEDGVFEVFVNVGKAGSDTFSFSEAIGRLVSLNLQMPDGLSRQERVNLIIYQLKGIGGDRQSVPDAVAKVLSEQE